MKLVHVTYPNFTKITQGNNNILPNTRKGTTKCRVLTIQTPQNKYERNKLTFGTSKATIMPFTSAYNGHKYIK